MDKKTIKPRVVPFEIADLLKEVGYNEKIAEVWSYQERWTGVGGKRMGGKYNNHYGSYVAHTNSEWETEYIGIAKVLNLNEKHPFISAPSYDMVLDWIYENIGCFVKVDIGANKTFRWSSVSFDGDGVFTRIGEKDYPTRYEAMDAAFLEILKTRKYELRKYTF